MIEIKGKHNTALCYCTTLEETAAAQIKSVCNQPEFEGCKIRIMPDVHAGMGCTIGTTMTILDKIVPGMVGVDIGCGIETVQIAEKEIDFSRLDHIIRKNIPSGRDVRKTPHPFIEQIDLEQLRCKDKVNLARARKSIGSLGGGNHFIEVDKDEDGNLYLCVHSGSRHIGNEVAKYYQQAGYEALCGVADFQLVDLIKSLKEQGKEKEIEKTIKTIKKQRNFPANIPKDLAWVEGQLFDDYIHDMKIIQQFASLNRKAMTQIILEEMNLTKVDHFTTIHNYIDTENMILRKGAVAAHKGQKLLIPINMRDGSLICIGKGNDDWNQSAPHGAGRIMSRKKAFEILTMDDYRKEMTGIYTTSVNRRTIDEAPMAYKDMSEIVENIQPTADIIKQIKPVYNFKAAE